MGNKIEISTPPCLHDIMVKICLLDAAQNATERQLLFAYQSGHRERGEGGGKRDGLLFGMRDMFGDKAAAYATYKWVIVGQVAPQSCQ